MTDTNYITDDDSQKLTAREETRVKELERLAEHLEEANLLYGSALDGMQPGLEESARKLDAAGLDEKITAAEEGLAQQAADILESDVAAAEEVDASMDADDLEERDLFAGDEAEPGEPAA